MGCEHSKSHDLRPASEILINSIGQLQQSPWQAIQLQLDIDQLQSYTFTGDQQINNPEEDVFKIKKCLRPHRYILSNAQQLELDRILSELLDFKQQIEVSADFTLDDYKNIMLAIYLDYPEIFWTTPNAVLVDDDRIPKGIQFLPFNVDDAKQKYQKFTTLLEERVLWFQDRLNFQHNYKNLKLSVPDIIYQHLHVSTCVESQFDDPFYSYFTQRTTSKQSLASLFYYFLISFNIPANLVPVKREVKIPTQKASTMKSSFQVFEFGVEFDSNGQKFAVFNADDRHDDVRELIRNYKPIKFEGLIETQLYQMGYDVVHMMRTKGTQLRTKTSVPLVQASINDLSMLLAEQIKEKQIGWIDLPVEGLVKLIAKQGQTIKSAVEKALGAPAKLHVWIEEPGYVVFVASKGTQDAAEIEYL
ncbi:Conserved_hypothetical protein [Hexamita inflata]|uniref:Uncharacterized protein n=1 Tax=Hexamita inflata TaxID=28002 RepID=A0AA86NGI7_9EUKA|nr:Conserved hypothetical protein [Hexamita inflata]